MTDNYKCPNCEEILTDDDLIVLSKGSGWAAHPDNQEPDEVIRGCPHCEANEDQLEEV